MSEGEGLRGCWDRALGNFSSTARRRCSCCPAIPYGIFSKVPYSYEDFLTGGIRIRARQSDSTICTNREYEVALMSSRISSTARSCHWVRYPRFHLLLRLPYNSPARWVPDPSTRLCLFPQHESSQFYNRMHSLSINWSAPGRLIDFRLCILGTGFRTVEGITEICFYSDFLYNWPLQAAACNQWFDFFFRTARSVAVLMFPVTSLLTWFGRENCCDQFSHWLKKNHLIQCQNIEILALKQNNLQVLFSFQRLTGLRISTLKADRRE